MGKSSYVVWAGAAVFGLSVSAWAQDAPAAGAQAMHHAATTEGASGSAIDGVTLAV